MNIGNIYDDTRCQDCKVETNHLRVDGDVAEWYMVNDHVWEDALTLGFAYFLCIGCLEKRIGRQLVVDDFKNAPLNWVPGYGRSERLRNRLEIDCV